MYSTVVVRRNNKMSATPEKNQTTKEDPFLKSLAALRKIVSSSSPAKQSLASPSRRLSVSGQQEQSDNDNDDLAFLRQQVSLEQQQREALERAVQGLQTARQALQSQLDIAQNQTKKHAEAYAALQTQMQELRTQHAAELAQAQTETTAAVQAQQAAETALDEANARVASLEAYKQEMQQKMQDKQAQLQKIETSHQQERAMQQKNIEVLLSELKKVSWKYLIIKWLSLRNLR